MGTLSEYVCVHVLYANIDKFDPSKFRLEYGKLSVMDKWILSRLYTLIGNVGKNLDNYQVTESARDIQDFTDELSNWYVRRCRERFWQKEMNQDKINAYMTLHTVLVELSKTIAPFVPFISEQIYLNLVRSIDPSAPESVHLCDFPAIREEFIDKELENNMDKVLKYVVLGRACRNTANIKNRQPLSRMFIKDDEKLPGMSDSLVKGELDSLIRDELNIKEILFTESASEFTTYKFKPQLRTVGPRYGKLVPKIAEYLAEADGDELMMLFNRDGKGSFSLEGGDAHPRACGCAGGTARKKASESDRGITVA